MGGAESTPERSADELLDDVDMPPEKRRNLRRNFNMLSDTNQVSAGFGAAEWSSVVEPALAAALFQKMRVEELPLQTVRATTDLSETEMEELLQQMDDNNKVMCRQGQVYII